MFVTHFRLIEFLSILQLSQTFAGGLLKKPVLDPGKTNTNNIPSTPPPSQQKELPHTISPKDGGTTWILDRPDNLKLVYFSSSFTQEEINFMSHVMTIVSGKASYTYKDKFMSCVNKFTNKNSPDNSFLDKTPIRIIYSHIASARRIYFQKTINAPERTLANAELDLNRNNRDFYLININSIHLHPYSDFSKLSIRQKSLFMRGADIMAGVVVHEMLHNLGYDHNQYSQTENDNNRIGNFVYEAGWCVGRGYKDKPQGTLGLTDPSNYHVD